MGDEVSLRYILDREQRKCRKSSIIVTLKSYEQRERILVCHMHQLKHDDYYYQSHFVKLFIGSQFLQNKFYMHGKSYKTLLELIPVYSSRLAYIRIYFLTTSGAIQIKLREVLKFLLLRNFLTLHM